MEREEKMRTKYCYKCNMETEVSINSKKEIFKVRGEDIIVNSSVTSCIRCEEDIFDEELDEKNIELAYSAYRKKHNLLLPIEIEHIREKYGLSQRALGRLLEWGEITVNRYENGAIQDAVHNDILKFILNTDNMLEIYEKNNHLLPSHIRMSLKKRIDELLKEEAEPHFRASFERLLLSNKVIDEFTGFRMFDLTRVMNIILYIAQSSGGVFKTKLNKLLWYVDFLNFKIYSVSISGSNYYHLPLGPILDDYDLIIGYMIREKLLKKEEVSFGDGIVGEKLKVEFEYNGEDFSESELKVMNYVIEYFKNYNCRVISDYSHNEIPYKKTPENKKISYVFSSDLSLEII